MVNKVANFVYFQEDSADSDGEEELWSDVSLHDLLHDLGQESSRGYNREQASPGGGPKPEGKLHPRIAHIDPLLLAAVEEHEFHQ